MNNIEKSRKYLQDFMSSHYKDYFFAMNEYRSNHGYGDFPNSSKIIQCMRDIFHIMEDEFSDLSIPQKFATPDLLIQTVKKFIKLLKSYDLVFKTTIKSYSDSNLIPDPIFEINKRRLEVLSACQYFIKMAKREKYIIDIHPKTILSFFLDYFLKCIKILF